MRLLKKKSKHIPLDLQDHFSRIVKETFSSDVPSKREKKTITIPLGGSKPSPRQVDPNYWLRQELLLIASSFQGARRSYKIRKLEIAATIARRRGSINLPLIERELAEVEGNI